MATLLITNGDSAAGLLKAAPDVNADDYLPWRDMLHAGPLVYTDALESFWQRRVDFLSELGGTRDAVIAMSQERDDILARHADFDRIEVWLEHDLYDQLQLIQILDVVGRMLTRVDGVFLVQADDFLGLQSPRSIGRFRTLARPVGAHEFELASHIWHLVCADTPAGVASLALEPVPSFPHLQRALYRFLEELPGPDGLSRTRRTILKLVSEGETAPKRLFGAAQATEEAAFLGDLAFFADLDAMVFCDTPLITGPSEPYAPASGDNAARDAYLDGPLAPSDFGRAVADGKADFLSRNAINQWWGGTHLTTENLWRFSAVTGNLVAP